MRAYAAIAAAVAAVLIAGCGGTSVRETRHAKLPAVNLGLGALEEVQIETAHKRYLLEGDATAGATITVNGQRPRTRRDGHWHHVVSLSVGANTIPIVGRMARHRASTFDVAIRRERSAAERAAIAQRQRDARKARERRRREAREAREASRRAREKAREAPKARSLASYHTMAATCGNLPVARDRHVCEDSYSFCEASAEERVRAAHNETGPRTEVFAEHVAKETYGSTPSYDGGEWEFAYAGCEGAFLHEYDILYH